MSFQTKMYLVSEDGKESRHYSAIECYHNGFAPVSNGNGWGFIDEEFNEICELKYLSVLPFNNGYSAVKDFSGKWGFINTQGEEICEPKYSNIWDFSPEGIALVSIGGVDNRKYGFINKNGEEICEPKYDRVYHFYENGYAPVGNIRLFGLKTGYINGQGKFFKKLPKEAR